MHIHRDTGAASAADDMAMTRRMLRLRKHTLRGRRGPLSRTPISALLHGLHTIHKHNLSTCALVRDADHTHSTGQAHGAHEVGAGEYVPQQRMAGPRV